MSDPIVTRKAADFLPPRLANKLVSSQLCVAVRADGHTEVFGGDEPVVQIEIVNDRGMAALRSLSELRIVDAYLDGDLDAQGDLIAGMGFRELLSDVQPGIWLWALVQPWLVGGRRRCNPAWVSKHYDLDNLQLIGMDRRFNLYTPGMYATDEDTLEEGAERKLGNAFQALNLSAGHSLLDVGCGWGGFLRYSASRGVKATGISLSSHQLAFARRRLAEDGLEATVLFQDFFTYAPGGQFDAINLMGSIEELSNYRAVMQRLRRWLKPQGRIYLDFASVDRRWGNASFVTKHVWPGHFRMVHMPQLTAALAHSGLDIVELQNDRRNYYLWPKKSLERWEQRKDEVVAAAGERMYRLMRVLLAGAAHCMSPLSERATAYRMVLAHRRWSS